MTLSLRGVIHQAKRIAEDDGRDWFQLSADAMERYMAMAAKNAGPTHRPSRLDAEHTACGEKMYPGIHLQLGDGETCERCTHVVAQIAAAVRGEPSWAQKT